MGVEIVVAVHVTVLAVGMILKATQNNRATRTAARRGAKGVGEIGVVGSIPAIANAVLDALWEHGVSQFDMPAHPQNIWKLLQKQKTDAN